MCAINKIAKQALRTFRHSDKKSYSLNLEKLLALADILKATDVGLSVNGDDISNSPYPLYAPVCHVNILELPDFTIGLFIIRKGMAIPLHDHPGMIGICKILYGAVKVTSYNATNGALSLEEHNTLNDIAVDKLPEVTLTASSKCEVLDSHKGNFHSVQSLTEDAAMFDILSPPYAEDRDCHYYREVLLSPGATEDLETNNRNCVQCYLTRTSQPFDFYCDQLPYKGPDLILDDEEKEEA